MSDPYDPLDPLGGGIQMNAPQKVALRLGHHTRIFLQSTGFDNNSQPHHETTRQIFDYLSNNFRNFTSSILMVPNFKIILNEPLYQDGFGNLTPLGKRVRAASLDYGMAIYFACFENGIVVNMETVPYILENVHSDICLLAFAPN